MLIFRITLFIFILSLTAQFALAFETQSWMPEQKIIIPQSELIRSKIYSFTSIVENKFLLKFEEIKLSSDLKKQIIYENNEVHFLFLDQNNFFWSSGYTASEFEHEVNLIQNKKDYNRYQSQIITNPQINLLRIIFFQTSKAQGSDPAKDCSQNPSVNKWDALAKKMGILSFKKILEKCHFSLSEIIEKNIEELKKFYSAMENLDLLEFSAKSYKSYHEFKSLLSEINTKLISPLSEIWEKVPPLAEKLICDFTENKIRDVFQAVATGGVAITRLTAKNSIDITELSAKIFRLTKNSTLKEMLVDVHARGKLDAYFLSRLSQIESDIPSEMKRSIGRADGAFSKSSKYHFEKHAAEFGATSEKEYEKKAVTFAKSVSPENLAVPSRDGRFIKWNTKTNEFLVVNNKNEIASYYVMSCRRKSDMILKFLLETTQAGLDFCQEY